MKEDSKFDRTEKGTGHLTQFNPSRRGFLKFLGIAILESSSDPRAVKPRS